MAQCFNGFVYHTKYDTIDVIPRESLQNTGDNILSLVRGLANATELRDTEVKTELLSDLYYTKSFYISIYRLTSLEMLYSLISWDCTSFTIRRLLANY